MFSREILKSLKFSKSNGSLRPELAPFNVRGTLLGRTHARGGGCGPVSIKGQQGRNNSAGEAVVGGIQEEVAPSERGPFEA
eukprot:1354953-Amorphochlora_amoeboformis.AAC.1